jgi:flagellin
MSSSMVINTNVSALQAIDNLDQTGNSMASDTEQLSTGLQINSAADNPAGYVISQDLQFQANGYQQAINNAQNGISMIQTANGALQQIQGLLQTMNTLAVASANGATNDTASLNGNQQEFLALQNEITQISSTTQFGGQLLLNGSLNGATLQIGNYNLASNQILLNFGGATLQTLNLATGVVGANYVACSVGGASYAALALACVQTAIDFCATSQATLGATQIELQGIVSELSVTQENITAANAQLVDVNFAQATTQFTTDQILMQSGVAMLSQAQQTPALVLKLLQ